ncbi:serine/threonine protein phosphatase [Thalassobius vesicularis]|uniref:Serine/threonine protein phosphatase n=1 Tax=Thalassobius vesicularis TaxID=1294297 RepID=A0A4S3MED3_9RHOB|nr:metallophosphoesterase family protein [Thalassobius vesicularis]THD76646.1 serine/threonine protein phosphatase [Thalassobius vesicularis]
MTPIYAVGDIHGQLEMLETALSRIEADGGPDAKIVFVGDLVDRGAGSRQVIERLMQGQAEGRDWTVLSGNHDDLFVGFLERGADHDPRILSGVPWSGPRIGGKATLASYGMQDLDRPIEALLEEARQVVPPAHLAFLKGLPLHHEAGALLFVHAGIRPGVALKDQTRDDQMWIRGDFLNDTRAHPWLVVHGHTAVEAPEHHGNRVNLDSGAGYGRPITAAVFEGREVWTLEAKGRATLLANP